MIFDNLDKLEMYLPFLPKLQKVIEILDRGDIYEQENGRYTTDDPDVRYVIMSYETTTEPGPFEIHRVETDVQIVLAGSELLAMTWRELASTAGEYDEKKDAALFDGGEPTVVLNGIPGRFVVFFPGEPHKAQVSAGEKSTVKKVVFKLKD